jgi:hypothetical protein
MNNLLKFLCLPLIAGFIFLSCKEAPTEIASETKTKKVLYVTHFPGNFHDFKEQEAFFQGYAKEAGWDVTVMKTDIGISYADLRKARKGTTPEDAAIREKYPRHKNYAELLELLKTKDFAKGYDVVVYNFCMAETADLEAAHNIMEQTRTNGVPAMLIHGAMHCFWPTYRNGTADIIPGNTGAAKTNQELVDKWTANNPDVPFPAWGDFTGIASSKHGDNTPITYSVAAKDHPSTQRITKDFVMNDTELYDNIYQVDGVVPLINGQQGESKAVAMWECPQGKSKVIGFTAGHATPDWTNENFKFLVIDGINYLIANPN